MNTTSSSRRSQSALVGFLTVEKLGETPAFIGAWMVTDERGYPLEFKATTPVKPSPVQRVLYGDTLELYVNVELCGKKLLADAVRKPSVVLVPASALLQVSDGPTPTVICIRRAGEALVIGDETSRGERGTIQSPENRFQPIIYEASFSSREERESILELLIGFSSYFDLVEVFERMRAAIKKLTDEDPRYRL